MSNSEEAIGYLKGNDYQRKTCVKCGMVFWTLQNERTTCGEVPCDHYSFIGNPPTSRKYSLAEMREDFLSFFEKRGHKRVKRYPIVARWREDVYLVNASIYDFQPHVTSGKVPPPGNPLVISQPCIRTLDLDNVGKTGRHLSVFEMGGAKAFNFPHMEIYWKDKAVEYAVEFLTHLGVDKNEIVFKEKPWAGGGNGGSSLEVMVRGLEVATLVFMDTVEDPEGEVDIEGTRYRKMENRIVDTGYGVDRLTWLSQGTETVYESLYSEMVERLMKEGEIHRPNFLKDFIDASSMEDGSENRIMESISKEERENVDKLSYVYILADHSRALTFLLYDGLVPSNSKAGYVLRMMIRRSLLALKKLNMTTGLWNLIEEQKNHFKDLLDLRLESSAFDIVKLEEERFEQLLSKGDGIIKKYSKRGEISSADVVMLFESNGLPIEYVKERSMVLGIKFPENLEKSKGFTNIRKEEKEKEIEVNGKYVPTEKSYYSDEKVLQFTSKLEGQEGNYLVLKNTYFYPEGGGQPPDHGFLTISGKKIEVEDTQLMGDVVLHKVNDIEGIRIGSTVYGSVNRDRRERLMQSHTATHILLSSIRHVLGNHVWQAGAQKDERVSRLDVTHYREVTQEEVKKIEERANEVVRMNVPLHKEFVNRNDAESEFGFTLYQGGIPNGNLLRLVEIPGIDAEGCGGTHLDFTGEVGFIKIVKVQKIQDGIIRFNFAAGKGAVEYSGSQELQLSEIKEKLGEEPLKTFESTERNLDTIKEAIEAGFKTSSFDYGNGRLIVVKVKEAIAENVSRSFMNSSGIVVSEDKVRITSSVEGISALELMKILEEKGYARGGGNEGFSQGKVLKEFLSVKDVEEAIINHSR